MLANAKSVTVSKAALRQPRRHVAARAQEDIYIGKGKYVKDDPKKYPSKTELTGGWAGGEAGLMQFLAGLEEQAADDVKQGPATKLLGGKDVIYTGQGNYVRDDASKYPDKTQLTGGFAGGEKGVRKFVDEGDISFEDEFRPQSSPLIVGLAISGVAIVISSIWFALEN